MISASDNGSTSLDHGLGTFIVENPLVDAENGLVAHAANDHISVNVLKTKGKTSVTNISQYDEDLDIGVTSKQTKLPSRYPIPFLCVFVFLFYLSVYLIPYNNFKKSYLNFFKL